MNMIKIRTFDSSFLANITLTKLHNSGLECYLYDEETVSMNPIYSSVIGGIRLMVKEEDAERGLALLKQFDEDYLKAVKCPKCGESDVRLISKPGPTNFLTAILTWALSSYAVAPENVYQCGRCGYESKDLPVSYDDEESQD